MRSVLITVLAVTIPKSGAAFGGRVKKMFALKLSSVDFSVDKSNHRLLELYLYELVFASILYLMSVAMFVPSCASYHNLLVISGSFGIICQ